jgi:NAD(P)H dehydrogenase (quinone)
MSGVGVNGAKMDTHAGRRSIGTPDGDERNQAMSGRIAVIYTGDLAAVADVFAEAAGHVATQVRTARLGDIDETKTSAHPPADLSQLEWADGVAFGTPAARGRPAPALMDFLDSSEPLWRNRRLYDKAVTVFTDEPERMAPDSILHPIYDALYHWGAVIIGPRYTDLSWGAQSDNPQAASHPSLPGARQQAAQYRARRLSRFASLIAEERGRMARLQL